MFLCGLSLRGVPAHSPRALERAETARAVRTLVRPSAELALEVRNDSLGRNPHILVTCLGHDVDGDGDVRSYLRNGSVWM